ncbi:SH3 domain-containing protein [Devosia beringensis]|uniref:SH3 domain-containing protein n=1 Tax=Devosia beringensis TaxID=2657486 RepID=UPI00186BAECA|nr:SH3 domain-containing protein [Devosia beringensis]
MALSKKIITGGLAVLALVASAAAAYAAPAYATGNVNVRSGPGTHYGVIDTLRRGDQVDVRQCRGSWCFVERRGPDGWVSASYLSQGGYGGYDDYDRWDDGYDHWAPPRPPRPGYWPPVPPRPTPVYPVYPAYPSYPPHSGGSVCVNGPNGYFCVGN